MNREELIRDLWNQVDDLQAMREHWATLDEDQWLAAADQVMGYGDED